ncbi:1,3-beta-glucanosyltransferase [Cryptotrichosporon argae]
MRAPTVAGGAGSVSRLAALAFMAAALSAAPAAAVSPITRVGRYLYDASGARFYIKGIAYQPQGELETASEANAANGGFPEPSSYIDPLSSAANCTRDIPYLTQLGVNAVRVYSVNSSLDHDACMTALSTAGIYVLLDVSLPLNGSIDRASPAWTTNLLDEYITTIDAFRDYDNLLAFNIGNEVVNVESNTNAAPFIKAAARDTKAYLKSVNSSALVSYAAVDGTAEFRDTLADYLTCGADAVALDLYGLNNYEWCGNATLQSSGWQAIVDGLESLPVAAWMSEYGCTTAGQRLWTEVAALFASPVTDVFSGGAAFSYFPTTDGHGIVNISTDGTQIITGTDFSLLSAQYNASTGPNSPSQSSSTVTTTSCPAENATLLASTTLPPTPDESVCICVNVNALACHVNWAAANSPDIVGELTNYACNLLASTNSGASCDAIAGNGTSGVYGVLAMCSPAIKLSYAMSAYWEYNPIDSSCDFAGNATLNLTRPTSDQVSAAAQSCLAAEPSGGVFTPTALSSATSTSTRTATSTGASASASSSAAASADSLRAQLGGLGTVAAALGVALGGVWVLV